MVNVTHPPNQSVWMNSHPESITARGDWPLHVKEQSGKTVEFNLTNAAVAESSDFNIMGAVSYCKRRHAEHGGSVYVKVTHEGGEIVDDGVVIPLTLRGNLPILQAKSRVALTHEQSDAKILAKLRQEYDGRAMPTFDIDTVGRPSIGDKHEHVKRALFDDTDLEMEMELPAFSVAPDAVPSAPKEMVAASGTPASIEREIKMHEDPAVVEAIKRGSAMEVLQTLHLVHHHSLKNLKRLINWGQIRLPKKIRKGVRNITELRCDSCDTMGSQKKHPRDAPRLYDFDDEGLWMGDLFGPMAPNHRGHEWGGVAICKENGMGFVFSQPKKSDTVTTYTNNLPRWEAKAFNKMRTHMSDRGTEYTAAAMQESMARWGVHQNFGAPDSSADVAENRIGTVTRLGDTFLHQAGAPAKFWTEAYSHAMDSVNWMPSDAEGHNGRSHYEMANGHKPPLHKAAPFGCAAKANIPASRRRKRRAKAVDCIHLRVCPSGDGWRLFNPTTRKIFHSRSVTFNRVSFPWKGVDDQPFGFVHQQEPAEPVWAPGAGEPARPAQHAALEGTSVSGGRIVQETSVSEGGGERGELGQRADEPAEGGEMIELGQLDDVGLLGDLSSEDEQEEEDAVEEEAPDQGRPQRERRQTQTFSVPDFRYKWEKSEPVALATVTKHSNGKWRRADVEVPTAGNDRWKWAEKTPQAPEWRKSSGREIQSFIDSKAFERVSRKKMVAEGRRIVKSMMMFKLKGMPSDEFCEEEDFKARFVIAGFQQKPWEYGETFAPTPSQASNRLVTVTALKNGWKTDQLDVKTAFLLSTLSEEHRFVMEPPPGHEADPDVVWMAISSIYGSKAAPHYWNTDAVKFITTELIDGSPFKRCHFDPCVFRHRSKRRGRKPGKVDGVLSLHVDDFAVTGEKHIRDEFKAKLAKRWPIKDLGELNVHLGVVYTWSPDRRSVELSQHAFIDELLSDFNMADCNGCHTPQEERRLQRATSPISKEEERFMRNKDYREGVGKVNWLAQTSRPDIKGTSTQLSQHVADPRQVHWNALMRLLRYLKQTRDHVLRYTLDNTDKAGRVYGYTDSDFAPKISYKRRSTTGWTFHVHGGILSGKSKGQSRTADSTAEAELVALNSGAKEAMWLRRAQVELGWEEENSPPMTLRCDNNAAKQIAEKRMMSERTKHLDTSYFVIRDFIDDKDVKVERVNTNDNVADIYTKPLGRRKFERFRDMMGVVPGAHTRDVTSRDRGSYILLTSRKLNRHGI